MRTFITFITLQGGGNLKTCWYEPQGFMLKHNLETSFPIIPIICEMLVEEPEEDYCIIPVRFQNADSERNEEIFRSQLMEIGVDPKKIQKSIILPENQSGENCARMLTKLIEAVPDHSEVSACLTFGSKIVTIIMTFALICMEKLKMNCQVEGMYYGEVQRENGAAVGYRLYNAVTLMKLSTIVDEIDQMRLADPEAFLKNILGVDEDANA